MTRRNFSKRVKLAAWERCGGQCEECTAKLFAGGFDYDHNRPDWLLGEPTLENCRVLCKTCHDMKTREYDRPRIDKGKRQLAMHAKAKAPSSRPIAGSRASGWRKPMNRPAERR